MTTRNGGELPINFALELASDLDAMDAFAEMSEASQQACIDESLKMNTRSEMQEYVSSIKRKHREKTRY